MANETLLTQEAYERLKREVEELKGPVRHRVAEAIREAKSHGDLRENAAYHEAKLNQTRLESRIAELEKTLQLAKIVKPSENGEGGAHLGARITLEDVEFGDEMTITLVSSYEADPTKDLISISSPLGSALLGTGVGDSVEVDAPAGRQSFRVKAVE